MITGQPVSCPSGRPSPKNWLLNRQITFGDRPSQARALQWAKFVVKSLVEVTANVGTYVGLTTLVDYFYRNLLIVLLFGIALSSILNFVGSTLYVYPEASTKGRVP